MNVVANLSKEFLMSLEDAAHYYEADVAMHKQESSLFLFTES